MSVATHCHGCGIELPPVGPATRNRKWCSERCRKAQYAGTCIDCGAATNGHDGRGPNAAKRCASCGGLHTGAINIERAAPQRRLIERLWAEGQTAREIAVRVGWTTKRPSILISVLRGRGYDLPHRRSPEQLERILAGSSDSLAKARQVLAERRPAA